MYKRLNIECTVAGTVSDLVGASRIILPGVGSFDHAMDRLDQSGMRDILNELVLDKKVPVLGICVGMQMLGNSSEEGTRPGLGWIEGNVKKFDISKFQQKTHLPHMGWNDFRPKREHEILIGLEQDARFYFLHSYYFECENEVDVLATSDYGGSFSCMISSGNIFGIQCHPEKSHHFGAQLLKNFSDI